MLCSGPLYEYRTSVSSTEEVTITVGDSDCSDLDLSDSTSDKEGSGEEIKFNPLSLGEQTSDSFDSLSEFSDQEDPSVCSLISRSVK